MSELLPCPCCESTNLVGGNHADDCVYCKDCFLRAVSPEAWNTRAALTRPADHAGLVAALREIVEHCDNTGYGDPIVNERIVDRCDETARTALERPAHD